MTNCPDLCTAAKCAELEARINTLEELLNNHLNQSIPEAHLYNNTIEIKGALSSQGLFLTVATDSDIDTVTIPLPFVFQEDFDEHLNAEINQGAHNYNPDLDVELNIQDTGEGYILGVNVSLESVTKGDNINWLKPKFEGLFIDGSVANKTLFLTVAGNGLTDTANIPLPFVFQEDFDEHLNAEINQGAHNYNPDLNVELNIQDTGEGYILGVNVSLDSVTKGDNTSWLNPEFGAINIGGSVENKTLFLTVAANGSTDTADIPFPFVLQEDFDEHLQQAIDIAHKFNPQINLTSFFVGEQLFLAVSWFEFNSGILINSELELPLNIDLSEILQKIEECCQEISQKIIEESSDTRTTLKIENDQNQARIDGVSSKLDLTAGQLETTIEDARDDVIAELNNFTPPQPFYPEELLNQINNKVTTNNSILGGDFWEVNEEEGTFPQIKAETRIRITGRNQYSDLPMSEEEIAEIEGLDRPVRVNNLIDLIQAYTSVNYHRSGFQRLPATLLESLIKSETDQEIELFDTLSFQEWQTQQIDALLGQFPLKFDYKITDENDQEKTETIKIPNVAEALTQLLGLNLATTEETDNILNATMRCLIEARSGANNALLAYDYARANAEYLGYRGKQTEQKVDVSFTPGAASLRKALQPSEQKVIGWQFDDREDLGELIKRVLFSAEIIKAALFIPFNSQSKFTGDTIKENLEKQQQSADAQWEEFKNKVNNPTGRYKVDKPKANLKDLTIDEF